MPQTRDHPDPPAPGRPSRRIWGFMHALGADGPPREVVAAGERLLLQRRVKHDFWAATAFYIDHGGRCVVVKFGRAQPLLGLPMRWVGRWLARRESHFYRRLADVDLVPAWLGFVDDETGFAHAYAAGRPLSEAEPHRVDETFFAELGRLLAMLHDRQMAYVDLHKPQNVIFGDDGRPHLIDFQISYDANAGLKRWLLPGAVRRLFLRQATRADQYHLLKLKKRLRPDLLTASELEEVERRTWLIRIHRTVARPYYHVRRRLLGRWRRKGYVLPEGSR